LEWTLSELILSGVDLKTVKELANHESIITTEKYASAKRLTSEKAVENLLITFDFWSLVGPQPSPELSAP